MKTGKRCLALLLTLVMLLSMLPVSVSAAQALKLADAAVVSPSKPAVNQYIRGTDCTSLGANPTGAAQVSSYYTGMYTE